MKMEATKSLETLIKISRPYSPAGFGFKCSVSTEPVCKMQLVKFRLLHSFSYSLHRGFRKRCTIPGRQAAAVVATNNCRSSNICGTVYVALLVPGILRWLLSLWKIYVLLILDFLLTPPPTKVFG